MDLQEKSRRQILDKAIKRSAKERAQKAKDAATLAPFPGDMTPRAYGYGRISHQQQEEGDSLSGQASRVEKFYNFKLAEQGVQWAGFFSEPGSTSAYTNGFMDRHVGKGLIRVLRRGDHLIIDKVDRLWRDTGDCSTVLAFFKREGIELHFVDFGGSSCSMGTPFGDFMLTVMAAVAQLESAQMGYRIRATFAHKRRLGYYVGAARPLGTIKYGKKGKRRLKYHPDERSVMQEIVRCINEKGWGLERTSSYLEVHVNGHDPELPLPTKGRLWDCMRVKRGYLLELHYRLVSNPAHVLFSEVSKMDFREVRKYGLQNPAIVPDPIEEVDEE